MSVTYFIDSVERDRQQYPDPLNYTLDASQVLTWPRSTKEIKSIPSSHAKNPLDFASTVHLLSVQIPFPRPELYGDIITATSIGAANELVFPDPHGLAAGDRIWTSSNNGAPYGVPVDLPLYVVGPVTPTTFSISTSLGGVPLAIGPATTLSLEFVIYTTAVQVLYEDSRVVLTSPVLLFKIRCVTYKDNRNIRCLNGTHGNSTHILFRGGVTQGTSGAPAFIEWIAKAEQTQRWKLDDVIQFEFETRDGRVLDVFKESPDDQLKEKDPTRQSIISFIVTPFVRDGSFSNHFIDPYEG